jgi:hypothetical protein
MTEKFQEDKKLKKKLDNYTVDYEKSKTEVHFNAANTEQYLENAKLKSKVSNKGYTKDYKENVEGKHKGTAKTMEMDIIEKLKEVKGENYTADAKQRQKKYDRSLQDPDLEQMGKSQIMRSDKDYKSDYNANVLGKNIGAPIEGHLDYYTQKKVKEITNDHAYTADAKTRMRTFTLEPDAPVLRNNIEVQKQVNQAIYKKSGKDVIDKFKGFQQLDVFKNPYMNRHIINSENLSDAHYHEDYEIEKDCIYFPYNTTEHYSQAFQTFL